MSTSMKSVVTVRQDILAGIRAAENGPDLYEFLQSAVKLEHATIPPYLTALYSVRSGKNTAVAKIIRAIVQQEMLHMTIAVNILNAIGGAPVINRPDFIPTYPGPLPMSVDDGLSVPLEPLSLSVVENVFMRIELPETPQHFPSLLMTQAARGYATIGEFYDAIAAQINVLGDKIFTGDAARQVVDNTWFPADQLFPITNAKSAVHGIEVIKQQGEGSGKNPMDGDDEPAHYYRFEQILRGHELVRTWNPPGYAFTGPPVHFIQTDVIDLVSNSKLSDYAPDSLARSGVQQADYTYTTLLNALHRTFNGHPGDLRSAMGLMYEFRLVVLEKVVNQPLPSGKFAAPSFQFTPVAATNPMMTAA